MSYLPSAISSAANSDHVCSYCSMVRLACTEHAHLVDETAIGGLRTATPTITQHTSSSSHHLEVALPNWKPHTPGVSVQRDSTITLLSQGTNTAIAASIPAVSPALLLAAGAACAPLTTTTTTITTNGAPFHSLVTSAARHSAAGCASSLPSCQVDDLQSLACLESWPGAATPSTRDIAIKTRVADHALFERALARGLIFGWIGVLTDPSSSSSSSSHHHPGTSSNSSSTNASGTTASASSGTGGIAVISSGSSSAAGADIALTKGIWVPRYAVLTRSAVWLFAIDTSSVSGTNSGGSGSGSSSSNSNNNNNSSSGSSNAHSSMDSTGGSYTSLSASSEAISGRPAFRTAQRAFLHADSRVSGIGGNDLQLYSEHVMLTVRCASEMEASAWVLHIHACIMVRRQQHMLSPMMSSGLSSSSSAAAATQAHVKAATTPTTNSTFNNNSNNKHLDNNHNSDNDEASWMICLGDNDILALADSVERDSIEQVISYPTVSSTYNLVRGALPPKLTTTTTASIKDVSSSPPPSATALSPIRMTYGSSVQSFTKRCLTSFPTRARLLAFVRRLTPEHAPLIRAWEHIQAYIVTHPSASSNSVKNICSCTTVAAASNNLHDMGAGDATTPLFPIIPPSPSALGSQTSTTPQINRDQEVARCRAQALSIAGRFLYTYAQDAIPLPANVIRDVSAALARHGVNMNGLIATSSSITTTEYVGEEDEENQHEGRTNNSDTNALHRGGYEGGAAPRQGGRIRSASAMMNSRTNLDLLPPPQDLFASAQKAIEDLIYARILIPYSRAHASRLTTYKKNALEQVLLPPSVTRHQGELVRSTSRSFIGGFGNNNNNNLNNADTNHMRSRRSSIFGILPLSGNNSTNNVGGGSGNNNSLISNESSLLTAASSVSLSSADKGNTGRGSRASSFFSSPKSRSKSMAAWYTAAIEGATGANNTSSSMGALDWELEGSDYNAGSTPGKTSMMSGGGSSSDIVDGTGISKFAQYIPGMAGNSIVPETFAPAIVDQSLLPSDGIYSVLDVESGGALAGDSSLLTILAPSFSIASRSWRFAWARALGGKPVDAPPDTHGSGRGAGGGRRDRDGASLKAETPSAPAAPNISSLTNDGCGRLQLPRDVVDWACKRQGLSAEHSKKMLFTLPVVQSSAMMKRRSYRAGTAGVTMGNDAVAAAIIAESLANTAASNTVVPTSIPQWSSAWLTGNNDNKNNNDSSSGLEVGSIEINNNNNPVLLPAVRRALQDAMVDAILVTYELALPFHDDSHPQIPATDNNSSSSNSIISSNSTLPQTNSPITGGWMIPAPVPKPVVTTNNNNTTTQQVYASRVPDKMKAALYGLPVSSLTEVFGQSAISTATTSILRSPFILDARTLVAKNGHSAFKRLTAEENADMSGSTSGPLHRQQQPTDASTGPATTPTTTNQKPTTPNSKKTFSVSSASKDNSNKDVVSDSSEQALGGVFFYPDFNLLHKTKRSLLEGEKSTDSVVSLTPLAPIVIAQSVGEVNFSSSSEAPIVNNTGELILRPLLRLVEKAKRKQRKAQSLVVAQSSLQTMPLVSLPISSSVVSSSVSTLQTDRRLRVADLRGNAAAPRETRNAIQHHHKRMLSPLAPFLLPPSGGVGGGSAESDQTSEWTSSSAPPPCGYPVPILASAPAWVTVTDVSSYDWPREGILGPWAEPQVRASVDVHVLGTGATIVSTSKIIADYGAGAKMIADSVGAAPRSFQCCIVTVHADGTLTMFSLQKELALSHSNKDGNPSSRSPPSCCLDPALAAWNLFPSSSSSSSSTLYPVNSGIIRPSSQRLQFLGAIHIPSLLDAGFTRSPLLPKHTIEILVSGIGILTFVTCHAPTAKTLHTALQDAARVRPTTSHALAVPGVGPGGKKVRLQVRTSVLSSGTGSGSNNTAAKMISTPTIISSSGNRSGTLSENNRVVVIAGTLWKRGKFRTAYQPRQLRLTLTLPVAGMSNLSSSGSAPTSVATLLSSPSSGSSSSSSGNRSNGIMQNAHHQSSFHARGASSGIDTLLEQLHIGGYFSAPNNNTLSSSSSSGISPAVTMPLPLVCAHAAPKAATDMAAATLSSMNIDAEAEVKLDYTKGGGAVRGTIILWSRGSPKIAVVARDNGPGVAAATGNAFSNLLRFAGSSSSSSTKPTVNRISTTTGADKVVSTGSKDKERTVQDWKTSGNTDILPSSDAAKSTKPGGIRQMFKWRQAESSTTNKYNNKKNTVTTAETTPSVQAVNSQTSTTTTSPDAVAIALPIKPVDVQKRTSSSVGTLVKQPSMQRTQSAPAKQQQQQQQQQQLGWEWAPTFRFSVIMSDRTWHLAADTPDTARKWLAILSAFAASRDAALSRVVGNAIVGGGGGGGGGANGPSTTTTGSSSTTNSSNNNNGLRTFLLPPSSREDAATKTGLSLKPFGSSVVTNNGSDESMGIRLCVSSFL